MRTGSLIAIAAAVLVAGVALLLSSRSLEPVIGFPGGELSGNEQPHPDDWSASIEVGTVQVETRPDDPYSVNIWGVGIEQDFYVATRPEGTAWSRNIDANPNVRLRVGEAIYPLKAVSVSDEAERKRVLDAYVQKYEADLDDMSANAGLVYRLDAR